jgi:hypothetical protein
LLIEVGDGTAEEEAEMHLASWAPSETPPAIFDPAPAPPVYEVATPDEDMDVGIDSDAGTLQPDEPDATPPPPPEPQAHPVRARVHRGSRGDRRQPASGELERRARCQRGPIDLAPQLAPRPAVGDALDFAWSPDGQRLALRYQAISGPRIAVFAAPEWKELESEEALAPATLPELAPTARYRWAPDSRALAVELSGDGAPFVGGYVFDGARAIGLPPVEFTGPIETLGWRSPNTLYVISTGGQGAGGHLALARCTRLRGPGHGVRGRAVLPARAAARSRRSDRRE